MTLDTFLALPQSARDAAYDNTAAVANSAAQLQAFEARSALVAKLPQALLNQRYGPTPREQFDFFSGPTGSDTVLFIHGGYWQMRHKDTFRFVVEGALTQGASAALIGYTLAPEAALHTIIDQVHQGIAAVSTQALAAGHSGRIRLCGWSAGGHLTAMAMDRPEVIAGLGISGIYDLAPICHTYLNAALQLHEADALTLSPLRAQVPNKPFITAYGTAELPALQAQSTTYAHYTNTRALAIEGADHFSILNALAASEGALLQALLQA
ncbi:alpha/beta hydrolase [Lampropedia puyangensis]|uniref:Alpha/beta hydrolase n=1 Tax=Lampropedia puyangensis TaxID=1330072 RepID=A0A4V4GQP4_9BURK|nr:alpha/beta hydrolase [Lampropedia puyangensis]THT99005.1 alpha/beta hydrolase [Lampropedia puyangensis]